MQTPFHLRKHSRKTEALLMTDADRNRRRALNEEIDEKLSAMRTDVTTDKPEAINCGNGSFGADSQGAVRIYTGCD